MESNAAEGPGKAEEFLQYGGQAVIEGVMMRSPRFFAVACRRPDGRVVMRCEEVDKSIMGRLKWLNKPFLRGTLALIDAMALGGRALAFASGVQLEAEQELQSTEPDGREPGAGAIRRIEEEVVATSAAAAQGTPTIVPVGQPGNNRINDIAIGGTLVMGILFGVALFVLLPTSITSLLQRLSLAPRTGAYVGSSLNVLDGLIRMVLFFGYIAAISMMQQVRTVFMYHGAEHKAINTLEAGLPLTMENALQASRIHPRCGTSFIFVVLVVNLLVFAVLPRPAFLLTRFALHVAVIPLVAGLAYEVIKFAGRRRKSPLVRFLLAPGQWSQYLTTREPEPKQVEVALQSLYAVLEAEGRPLEDINRDDPDPTAAGPAVAIA